MSGVKGTPDRGPKASPDFHSPEGSDVHMDDLTGSMSAVKLEPSNEDILNEDTVGDLPINRIGAHKRLNRESIEGSPFILKKRTNVQTTPIAFQTYRNNYLETNNGTKQATATHPIFASAPNTPLTVIVSGSDEHDTGDHQENSRRTKLLVGLEEGCLRRASLQSHIHWIDADTIAPPPISDLLRVHEFEYLSHLESKCRQAAGQAYDALPFFYSPAGKLDTDTPLTDQSLEAAKRFCGASMAAVDILLENHFHTRQSERTSLSPNNPKIRNGNSVFVIGRPPGHHAGPRGCVPSSTYWKAPGMTSSGFCLLNTVAVAASYARHEYGRMAQSRQRFTSSLLPTLSRPPRIAIVDIDIHHGNGTEEIVRNLRPHQTFLPLPSSWAPQSNLSYKPWLNEQDAEETLFASVHLFNDEDFYPGSGQEDPKDIVHNNIINITLTPLSTDGKPKASLSKTKREDYCNRASTEFREKMQRILFPQLASFQADILFISAGFDAHYDDFYHYLTEDDIHWVTEQMMQICQHNNPEHYIGVVSVLEGGYSLESLYDHSHKEIVSGSRTRKPSARAAATASTAVNVPPGTTAITSPAIPPSQGKFAQWPGDGGLVKRYDYFLTRFLVFLFYRI
jgi:acetoin utilization deacetylase AcuC-like enzyme